jgi:hypothetical protein
VKRGLTEKRGQTERQAIKEAPALQVPQELMEKQVQLVQQATKEQPAQQAQLVRGVLRIQHYVCRLVWQSIMPSIAYAWYVKHDKTFSLKTCKTSLSMKI